MTTSRSVNVTVAILHARFDLIHGTSLMQQDLQALLDYIGDLEYEVSRLKGNASLMDLQAAFNRRAD